MPKITKIEKQKNHKERYNIYIDDSFAFGVMENTLLHFHLHKGKELSTTDCNNILKVDQFQKLYFKALNYISYMLRSEYEVREKLKTSFEKTDDQTIIAQQNKLINLVIKQLTRDNYINDEYYTKMYIQDAIALNQKGQFAIEQALLKKGISKTLIKQQLDRIDTNQVFNVALALGQSYVNKQRDCSIRQLKQKVKNHLIQKGFSFDMCDSIISQLDYTQVSAMQGDILKRQVEKLIQKYRRNMVDDTTLKQKITQQLMQKGFEYAHIKTVLTDEWENFFD